MFREFAMSSYMATMATGVGLTCDMGKDGRSEMEIGNGWVEHTRPDGKKFYVNNETKKRTWTRPENVATEETVDKCAPYVQKMRYEGKYPMGITTVHNDSYDCQSFLSKLYDENQKKVGGDIPVPQAVPSFDNKEQ